ncbi:MAG TPA: hypothetical protein VHE99_01675 [Gammaproteobacteria bacterium]|nr:hypothetical protein [Gammaproteobacteria bacterium]
MSKFVLCLSGFGNLSSIEQAPEGMILKIKVLSWSSDDIELECLVDEADLITRLDELTQACQTGEYVVLHFVAHYNQFSQCYAGLTEQDPAQMVQLKSRLMGFKGWLRDSNLPPATSPKDI